MTKTTPHTQHVLPRILAVALFLCLTTTVQADVQQRDTLNRRTLIHSLQPAAPREFPDLRHRMMTSPMPVEIHQQGRFLCVTSRYAQLLPVYNASGTLYSSFRLTKGTNWLSGLPRGSYFINNRKITIN